MPCPLPYAWFNGELLTVIILHSHCYNFPALPSSTCSVIVPMLCHRLPSMSSLLDLSSSTCSVIILLICQLPPTLSSSQCCVITTLLLCHPPPAEFTTLLFLVFPVLSVLLPATPFPLPASTCSVINPFFFFFC